MMVFATRGKQTRNKVIVHVECSGTTSAAAMLHTVRVTRIHGHVVGPKNDAQLARTQKEVMIWMQVWRIIMGDGLWMGWETHASQAGIAQGSNRTPASSIRGVNQSREEERNHGQS